MKKSIRKKNKKFIEPSPEIFQSLIYLYSNGDLQGTLNKAKSLLKEYPDSPTTQNSIPSDSVENKEIMGVENNTKT